MCKLFVLISDNKEPVSIFRFPLDVIPQSFTKFSAEVRKVSFLYAALRIL